MVSKLFRHAAKKIKRTSLHHLSKLCDTEIIKSGFILNANSCMQVLRQLEPYAVLSAKRSLRLNVETALGTFIDLTFLCTDPFN